MTPERFARVRAIFEAALERPARDRQVFVEGACVGDAALLRDVLGMLSADAQADPLLDRPPSTPASSAPDEGRFPAGTVLAGRYRILGLLGTGGMGEVYRAHDLILNQTVALKFLAPAHISEAALIRFRNEVRVARQVSHPNVCRVYDLGMVEGLHFLSMEYIDGEDLASLLRRIGRLPQDKAIEFTRKICAGLSAAHERGVLHRDLKPANIMIDGRGQPRITDFGLAGLAAEIPLSDLRSGTPAYMAPEQKAGKEVTVRSDLYALGLVLHEMFTGKARQDTQSSPTDLVKDLEPAIERLILRCLEEEPKRRPSSALQVAMALPGGDPIAAALAAGETPSPEMVAASQEKEGFTPRVAIACFVALVVCLPPAAFLEYRAGVFYRAPLPHGPEALEFRANEILDRLGYGAPAADRAFGFACCDAANYRHIEQMDPDRRDAVLASHAPPVVHFWYRQHRMPLSAPPRGQVGYDEPANDRPGMIRLRLDAHSRLIGLEVRPTEDDQRVAAARVSSDEDEADIATLFSMAGLDAARFQATDPVAIPPMFVDARRSWIGTYGDDVPGAVRVDAAWWQHQPVWFAVSGTWSQAPDNGMPWRNVIAQALLAVTFPGSLLLGLHHLRTGRGDRRGAAFVARLAFVCIFIGYLLAIHYVADGPALWFALLYATSFSLLGAVGLWGAYIGVEPYVRRRAPDALISLARLQAGRLRDPLVASHVLVGMATMGASLLLSGLVMQYGVGLSDWGRRAYGPSASGAAFESNVSFASVLFDRVPGAFWSSLQFLLIIVVIQAVFRRRWIADIAASMLLGLMGGYAWTGVVGFVSNTLFFYVGLVVLLRFGFLAMLARTLTYSVVMVVPPSLTAWYSGRYLFALGLPIAVGAWALWVILTDRRQLSTESAG